MLTRGSGGAVGRPRAPSQMFARVVSRSQAGTSATQGAVVAAEGDFMLKGVCVGDLLAWLPRLYFICF